MGKIAFRAKAGSGTPCVPYRICPGIRRTTLPAPVAQAAGFDCPSAKNSAEGAAPKRARSLSDHCQRLIWRGGDMAGLCQIWRLHYDRLI